MRRNETFEGAARRIEELIDALEALDDPRAREQTQELLRVILELHLAGLTRLMEIMRGTGDQGRAIVEAAAQDRQVSPMLLLHGLHPKDMTLRVQQAVEDMDPLLRAHGIRIQIVEITGDALQLRLSGHWTGQKLQVNALARDIEEAILDKAPELTKVMIQGLPEEDWQAIRFVGLLNQRGSGMGDDA